MGFDVITRTYNGRWQAWLKENPKVLAFNCDTEQQALLTLKRVIHLELGIQ